MRVTYWGHEYPTSYVAFRQVFVIIFLFSLLNYQGDLLEAVSLVLNLAREIFSQKMELWLEMAKVSVTTLSVTPRKRSRFTQIVVLLKQALLRKQYFLNFPASMTTYHAVNVITYEYLFLKRSEEARDVITILFSFIFGYMLSDTWDAAIFQ